MITDIVRLLLFIVLVVFVAAVCLLCQIVSPYRNADNANEFHVEVYFSFVSRLLYRTKYTITYMFLWPLIQAGIFAIFGEIPNFSTLFPIRAYSVILFANFPEF